MYTATAILACLALTVPFSCMTTAAEHGGFCYSDEEGCGPSTEEWGGQCQTGSRQSPINLPTGVFPMGSTPIKFSAYRGDHFRMQNNGHSIAFDFDNQGPSTEVLSFPDPLKVYGPYSSLQGQRQYRFASAHFHWGPGGDNLGSEHCVGGKCSAMELHLVHYLANYTSLAEAVASGDESALTVLGLFIDVNAKDGKNVGAGILNMILNRPTQTGANSLTPIARNLESVEHAEHDSSQWLTVNEPLDLSKMLFSAEKSGVYTYKGSLTTPGCNEQVNWFVLKKPAATTSQDLEAFRSTVKDGRGESLTQNYRPLQAKNGRKVLFSNVIGY